MNKKSIIYDLTKAFYMFLISIILFIIIIISYFFYHNYINNLKFLEQQTFKNFNNVIFKINENVISRYKVEYNSALKYKENEIKNRIFLAFSLLQNLYYNYKDKLTDAQIKRRAIYLLSLLKFDNGKSFFTIFSYKNREIVFAPYLDKINLDPVFIKVLDNIKKGNLGPFIVYWKPTTFTYHAQDSNNIRKKIIFGIYFDKFDWIVINGFFLDEFNKDFNRDFLKRVIEMKFPKYTGIAIYNKNNELLFSWNIKCNDILEKLKNIGNRCFKTVIPCDHYHYTVYKNEIFFNKWKVFTFFINEKVESTFNDARKKLMKNFIIQISLLILFVLLGFLIFYKFIKNFKSKLSNQLVTLIKFIKKVPETYEKIDHTKLEYYEIEEIGKYTNEMVDTIKQLNQEILKEKDFLNAVLENLPYGVGVLTQDLIITYANNYVFSYMGYDKSIIGKSFYDLIPKNFDRKKFYLLEVIKKVKEQRKSIIFEKIILYKKDGTFIYSTLAVSPIENRETGEIEEFIFVFYDITEEIKLKKEILKLKRAVENVPVSIVITDTRCRIEYVNPYFQKITGYSFEEAKGKTPKILATKENYKYYPEIMKKLKSGETWEGEFLNRKKNGELYWEHALISPIFDEKGKIINFVAVKEDVTERKKFIEELKKAKEKAEIASRAKSEFLANMSHEIRTPMNAIIGFIDLVLDTNLNETQRKYLQLVKESTDNLLRILNDILDISKFESAKIEFENTPINLRKIVTNCVSIFSRKVTQKNLQLHIEIDENIPEVVIGDEVRISQVLNNLLNNAVKFTEKGEIKVEAELVSIENNYATIQFCVSDTGIGIPKEKIDTIFDSFTQADTSITRRYGGTGLGLAIASKIVQHYNGKIWVESEVGKGSRFYFTLKLKIGEKKDLISEQEKGDEIKYFTSKYNILVAEDNVTNQILIEHILKNYGLNVTIAENGLEAIKKLAEKDYDLILMDWHMPEMNGVEALEILRKIEKGEEVQHEKIDKSVFEKLKGKKFIVIALTAAALKSEKESLLKKGFDDYISKPIKRDELSNILKKYLSIDAESKLDFKTREKKDIKDIININYLKDLVGDDKDLINTILTSFKHTLEESIASFDKYIKEKDFENIFKTAHNLKGAASNIGLNKVAELCVEIEKASKNMEIDVILEKFNYIKKIAKQ